MRIRLTTADKAALAENPTMIRIAARIASGEACKPWDGNLPDATIPGPAIDSSDKESAR